MEIERDSECVERLCVKRYRERVCRERKRDRECVCGSEIERLCREIVSVYRETKSVCVYRDREGVCV